MAIRAKTVAVTTTPAKALDGSSSSDGASGSVLNSGVTTVYVGGDDLTSGSVATTGFALPAGASIDVDLVYGEVLWVVAATGTGTLSVLAGKVS